MDEGSKLVRWGIPGWVVSIGFILFVVLDVIAGGKTVILETIQNVFKESEVWEALVTSLLVAGAGIPLGYVIYQIYFYIRWNSPVSPSGLLPPLIVGREQDLHDTVEDFEIDELTMSKPWRRKMLPNLEDHRNSWYYIARLVMDSMLDADSSREVYKRHSYLMSMLHSLGASLLGLSIGFASYVILKWEFKDITFLSMLFPPFVIFFVVLLLNLETKSETRGVMIGKWCICDAAEVLVASLLFLFITINPIFDSLLHFQISFRLVTYLSIFWMIFTRGHLIPLVINYLVLVLITFICRGILQPSVFANLHWPMVLSTLVFCALVIAFLENRQNVRNQLIKMEVYYLKKYLSEKSA